MLPFLVLASLVFSPDQPVAPATPGPAGAYVLCTDAATSASRNAVAYEAEGRIHVSFVSEGAVEAVTAFDGKLVDITGTRDGFLVAFQTNELLQVVKIRDDGTTRSPRVLGAAVDAGVMASIDSRTLLVTDDADEVILLDSEGRVVRRSIRLGDGDIEDPAMAANSEGFLVAWREGEAVKARAIDASGPFVSDSWIVAERGQWPAVASDGREFLVAWQSSRITGIEGRITTLDGRIATEPFIVTLGTYTSVSTSWDGASYAVVYPWDHEGGDHFRGVTDVYRVNVSPSGAASAPVRIADTGRLQSQPAIAGSVVTWIESLACATGNRVVATVGGGAPALVSIGLPVRHAPVAAPVGRTFATGWLERTDVQRVRARVGDRVLDLSSERASIAAPAIASSGQHVIVSWVENEFVANIGCIPWRKGVILDERGKIVSRLANSEGASQSVAASNGSEFVVAWVRAAIRETHISAGRIGAAGERFDLGPRALVRDQRQLADLSFVWTGSEYLAVWYRWDREILVQRFSATLDPIGDMQLVANGTKPKAAAGPESTLIAYRDDTELRGLILTHTGAAIARPLIAENLDPDAVAAWGNDFLVAAGGYVFRISATGEVTQLTTLPDGDGVAMASNGSRVHIAYEHDGEVFIRSGGVPRSRAVRH